MLEDMRQQANLELEDADADVSTEPTAEPAVIARQLPSSLPPIRTAPAPGGRRRPRHRRTRSILFVSPEDDQSLSEYSEVPENKPQWQLDAECLAHFEDIAYAEPVDFNHSSSSLLSDGSLVTDGSDTSSGSSCGTNSSNSSICGSEYGETDGPDKRTVEPQDEDPTWDWDSCDEYEEVVIKRRRPRGSTRRRSYHEKLGDENSERFGDENSEDVCSNDSYEASSWGSANAAEGRCRMPSLDGHAYVGLFLPTIDEE
jgi:hypothetical protein